MKRKSLLAGTAATSVLGTLVSSSGSLLLISLILFVSFFVRLHKLDSQSLECEELYTIPAATGHQYVYLRSQANTGQASFPTTTQEHRNLLRPESTKGLSDVTAVLKRNVHLPLYFYFMHYWIKLFGTSEWVLRLPSVLFGTLAVLMLFLLGKELFNPSVGLISALLMGLMPEQIHYSQQARMYPLLVLLVVSSTYAILLVRKHPTNANPYIFFSLTSIAGLYTHYVYFFCFAFQLLFIWVVSPLGKQNKRLWLTSHIFVLAALVPWILASLTQKKTSSEVISWVRGDLSARLIANAVFSKLTQLISVPEVLLGWVSALIAYGLLLLGLGAVWYKRTTLLLLCSWIIFPIIGILFLDSILGTTAINIMRYWMVITPSLYLLMSAGIQSINKRPLQIALVTALTFFLGLTAIWTAQGEIRGKPDRHQELAHFIDQRINDGGPAVVIADGVNSIPLALGHYGQREMKILRFNWLLDHLQKESLRNMFEDRKNVWLLLSGNSRARGFLEENGFTRSGAPTLFGHIWVFHYTMQPSRQKGSL